jgi:hypothetical protein
VYFLGVGNRWTLRWNSVDVFHVSGKEAGGAISQISNCRGVRTQQFACVPYLRDMGAFYVVSDTQPALWFCIFIRARGVNGGVVFFHGAATCTTMR